MNAPARAETAPRPCAGNHGIRRARPLIVLTLRAWARARLWQASDLDLHDAVDILQAAAIRDGLVAKPGQDRVQEIMAAAFAAVRDDPLNSKTSRPSRPSPTMPSRRRAGATLQWTITRIAVFASASHPTLRTSLQGCANSWPTRSRSNARGTKSAIQPTARRQARSRR